MSVKDKELGGQLPPRADELCASFQCFVAAVEQKTQQLLQKVAVKVRFKGEVFKNSEEFSDAFLDHVESLARYSDFVNSDDPNEILFKQNGGNDNDLKLLLLKTVYWKEKLETTIRRVSQDSGFFLPAELSHADLDNWQVHMSKLCNGDIILQVTTEQMQNILQGEVAVDTSSYQSSGPPDISIGEPLNTPVPSLELVSNEPGRSGMELFPESRPVEGNLVSTDSLKAVPPKPSTSAVVNGTKRARLKRRMGIREESRSELLEDDSSNGVGVKGRLKRCTSTSGHKIPYKMRGKFADTNVKHEEDTSCPLGVSCTCGFKGTSRRYLGYHVRRLNDEWKFPCHICGWYFFQNCQREQHYRRNRCKPCQKKANATVSQGSEEVNSLPCEVMSSTPVATSGRKHLGRRGKSSLRKGGRRNGESSRDLDKESVNCKSRQNCRRSSRSKSAGKVPPGTFETADQRSKSDLIPDKSISQGAPDENPDSAQPGTLPISIGPVHQPSAHVSHTIIASDAATAALSKPESNEVQSSGEEILSANHEASVTGFEDKRKERVSPLQTESHKAKRKRKRKRRPGAVQQPIAESALTTSGSEAASILQIQSTHESSDTVAINNKISEVQSSAEQIVSAHQGPSDTGSNSRSKEVSTGESFAMETVAQYVPSGNQCVTESPIQTDGRKRKRKRQRRQERLKLGRCGFTPRNSDEWKFKCSLCLITFYGFEQLKEHLSKEHGKNNEYPGIVGGCTRCGELFTNPNEWVTHHKGDRSPDILPGTNVSKTITRWLESSPEVVENIRVYSTSGTGPGHDDVLEIESCDVDVVNDPHIGNSSPPHEADPTSNESQPPCKALPTRGGKKGKPSRSIDDWKFACELCAEKFEHLSKLKSHLVSKHKVKNPYPEYTRGCTFCGQMFLTFRDMLAHRKDCSSTGEKESSKVQQGSPNSNETIRTQECVVILDKLNL